MSRFVRDIRYSSWLMNYLLLFTILFPFLKFFISFNFSISMKTLLQLGIYSYNRNLLWLTYSGMIFPWYVWNLAFSCGTVGLTVKIIPYVNVGSTVTWTSSGVKVYSSYTSWAIHILPAIFVATFCRSEHKRGFKSETGQRFTSFNQHCDGQ